MDIDQIVRPLLLKDLRAELRLRGQSPAGGQEELRARLKENMMVTGNFNITAEGAMGATHAGSSTADMAHGRLMNNYSRPGGQQNVGNFLTDKPSSRVLAPPGGGSQIMFGDYQDPYTAGARGSPARQQPVQQQGYPAPGPGYPQQMQQPYPGAAPGYHQPQMHAAPPPPGYYPTTAQYGGPMPGGGGSPGMGAASGGGFGASSSDVRGGSLSNNYARPGGQQNVGNFITDRPSSRVLAPPGGKSQITFG